MKKLEFRLIKLESVKNKYNRGNSSGLELHLADSMSGEASKRIPFVLAFES